MHCWEYPYLGVIDFVGMDERIRETSHDGAEALLDTTISKLRAAHPDDDVKLTPLLLEGSPAWTLLDAAKDADLVVVGSRGRGGLKTLLLGSVSHVVVTHAEIPVVVVRHAADGSRGPRVGPSAGGCPDLGGGRRRPEPGQLLGLVLEHPLGVRQHVLDPIGGELHGTVLVHVHHLAGRARPSHRPTPGR